MNGTDVEDAEHVVDLTDLSNHYNKFFLLSE